MFELSPVTLSSGHALVKLSPMSTNIEVVAMCMR